MIKQNLIINSETKVKKNEIDNINDNLSSSSDIIENDNEEEEKKKIKKKDLDIPIDQLEEDDNNSLIENNEKEEITFINIDQESEDEKKINQIIK